MKQLPEPERAKIIEKKALDIVKEACVKYNREMLKELLDKGFITQTDKMAGYCPLLRKAGVDLSAIVAVKNCLECPVKRCFLMRENHRKKGHIPKETSGYYQCQCGMTAMLHFIDGRLEKTRKFKQVDNQIIHSCGGICERKG